jgi:uncharacterized membrane protein YhiD involved in acid resistance
MLWKTFLRVGLPAGIMGSAALAYAQPQYPNPISYLTLQELIEQLLYYLQLIAIPLAVLALVVSGIYFIAASVKGEAGQLQTAKKLLFWALIGTILVVGAWAIATALVATLSNL